MPVTKESIYLNSRINKYNEKPPVWRLPLTHTSFLDAYAKHTYTSKNKRLDCFRLGMYTAF